MSGSCHRLRVTALIPWLNLASFYSEVVTKLRGIVFVSRINGLPSLEKLWNSLFLNKLI